MTPINYSIVAPFHNEEGNVNEFYNRLKAALDKTSKSWELIAVEDGSSDNTLKLLSGIAKKDKRLKVIVLSRNFGQQAAVTAGLENATGDVIVTVDSDLQDPPELLPKFFEKIDEGYDVVYAVSTKRDDPPVRKFLINSYYFVMDKLSAYKLPRNAGIFAVMRRPVVEVLLQITERNRFLPALRAWAGFKQVGLNYEKPARFSGKEAQSFGKLFRLGMDSLFSFSYVPLKVATYLGLFVSFLAFLAIADVLYQKWVAGTAILGWASPLVSTLFIGGVQLIILGIIGEYLGRIYDEVKRRPFYIVKEKYNFQ